MAREPEHVARDYFAALGRRDLDAAANHLAPDLRGVMHGLAELDGPRAVREFFAELFAALPDWTIEVRRTAAEGDTVAVHWRITGTFTGAPWHGLEANGARLDFQGADVITVREGRIAANDAFADGLSAYRQLGVLPPAGSATEARVTSALNRASKVARRAGAAPLEPVADGVWRLRGGLPVRAMNVYLLKDGGGVTAFDAGVRQMAGAIAGAAASLGGLRRVLLSHAHPGHRGAAARLGVPVICHPDARPEAETDGGRSYFDFAKAPIPARWTLPVALDRWDAGPVRIAGTVAEGDQVAGFRVVDISGHAPGQIALVRDRDRLALTADAFYVIDIGTGRPRPPHLPVLNQDDERARASLRRLAALDLAAAWPGHGQPLRGDVRGALERAAG
jgi:glyoxylase-like metal-dependent hydrolase (beta-lactamase superfamily II)/ketosteroid isomerase-like protein